MGPIGWGPSGRWHRMGQHQAANGPARANSSPRPHTKILRKPLVRVKHPKCHTVSKPKPNGHISGWQPERNIEGSMSPIFGGFHPLGCPKRAPTTPYRAARDIFAGCKNKQACLHLLPLEEKERRKKGVCPKGCTQDIPLF